MRTHRVPFTFEPVQDINLIGIIEIVTLRNRVGRLSTITTPPTYGLVDKRAREEAIKSLISVLKQKE